MTRHELRQRAEAMIEQLIAILDEIDGDPDLEQSLPEGMAVMAMPYPMEDDEDGHDAEALVGGRQIITLNPPPVPVRRIRRAA